MKAVPILTCLTLGLMVASPFIRRPEKAQHRLCNDR